MTEDHFVCETVSLDDLYHPETPEYYDPECCCTYCLDVSYAMARKESADRYRRLRRSGQSKIARLVWKKTKEVDKVIIDNLNKHLYNSSSIGSTVGGLQALFK